MALVGLELRFLVASGLELDSAVLVHVGVLFLEEIGDAPGEAVMVDALLFCARGLVTVFFPLAVLVLPVTGLVLGETFPKDELVFFVGEGERVVDNFLLPATGEEEPVTFRPVSGDGLELAFLLEAGLPFGDEILAVAALMPVPFALDLGVGGLLFDFGLDLGDASGQLRALSIIPIMLSSIEVCD